jgi:hypothetical protein
LPHVFAVSATPGFVPASDRRRWPPGAEGVAKAR